MKAATSELGAFAADYARRLVSALSGRDWTDVALLAEELRDCRDRGDKYFFVVTAAAPATQSISPTTSSTEFLRPSVWGCVRLPLRQWLYQGRPNQG